MTLRPRVVVLAVLLGWTVLPMPASAQQIRSSFRHVDEAQSAGAFAGFVTTDRGALDLGPASGPIFGVRYGIRINGPFTLEGEAGFLPLTRTVFTRDTAVADSIPRSVGEVDMSLAYFGGALRFNLTGPRTWHGLMPYASFGGGVAVDISEDSPLETDVPVEALVDFGTSFAGKLGAGIEWFASRRLTVRADFGDVLWQIETPQRFRTLDVPEKEWLQNLIFTAGLSLRF